MKNYLTEFIGTFFLVLAIGLSVGAGSSIGHMAPVAIGVTLMVMVYMGGHISGAHYNPAVTLAVLIRGKINGKEAGLYMLSQILGSLAAAGVASMLVQDASFNFGTALSPGANATYLQALLVEVLFTFALALVVLNVATTKATEGNSYYGLAIGFTVLAAAYAGGGISGGAFNPAVGIGPNVIGGDSNDLWIYLVGPFAGGALAGLVYKFQHPKG
ncbi:MAG: aquaporin [Bacteroidota bacterium]